MKNAVFYKDSWLMPTSTAFMLYQEWKKSGTPESKKKLDAHCKEVDKVYKQMRG